MKELTLKATMENLDSLQEFIRNQLETAGCSMKLMMQIEIAVEEIFVNIVHYAYSPDVGDVMVKCETQQEPLSVAIQFRDQGVPFNPLLKKDADTTLSADERQIGGLGILMVKKSMDSIEYSYKDGYNILTIRKNV